MLTRGMEEAVAEANGVMCLVGPSIPAHFLLLPQLQELGG